IAPGKHPGHGPGRHLGVSLAVGKPYRLECLRLAASAYRRPAARSAWVALRARRRSPVAGAAWRLVAGVARADAGIAARLTCRTHLATTAASTSPAPTSAPTSAPTPTRRRRRPRTVVLAAVPVRPIAVVAFLP